VNEITLDTRVTFLAAADAAGDGSAPGPRRFTIEAYTGAPIRQGWSREPVVIDLAGLQAKQRLPIVLGHDYTLGAILGQTDSVRVEGGKLVVEGEILAKNDAANQVLALADAGYVWQASIGADVRRHQKIDGDAVTQINGATHTGPLRVVRASVLREVSFVTLGADADTAVSIAAEQAEEPNQMSDTTNTTPAVDAAPIAAAVEAPAPVVAESTPDAAAALAATVETLSQKVAAMNELISTRDARPAAPAIHATQPAAPTPEVVEASFAIQGNLPGLDRHYSAQTLEAAHRVARTASLGEVIVSAAVANGYDGPRRLTAATLRPILAAAWATHSISGILSATVNKFLLAGFDGVESAWRSISSVRSVNDFKSATAYRLNGSFTFEKVAPGGELKSAGATDESRTIAADTYGIMTSVTRQDLINDDLGAITALPQRIGRGGAVALNKLFWSAFLNDGSFFTTARGNKKTSAAALSIAGLKEAVALFRKLTDPDGNPLAVNPAVLLVPVDLEITAAELMSSNLVVSGSTGQNPAANVFAGRYQVVSSAYLTNAADYYLLASPSDLPVMEVAFLNGQQSPIVETADADFATLGVQMRGYFDVGVSQAEYLAGVKMDV
jgi:phage head maturation protease